MLNKGSQNFNLFILSYDHLDLLTSMYKKLKHTVQKEQRKAYWKYIENIIFDVCITLSYMLFMVVKYFPDLF
jgi:hypothetical protein